MAERTLVERLRAIAEPRFSPLFPEEVAALHEAAAALERLEKLEKLLRLIEADDWPGMIELAKQAGIPDVWEHTHNPEDYELTGFHDDDGKYTYPTRANLTAALSRTLLATPAPAPQQGGSDD